MDRARLPLDGSGFDIVQRPFDELDIGDLWSPGPGQLYVGGERVLHEDNGSWELFGPLLHHVWGVAGDSVWGASFGGTIMRHRLPGGACDRPTTPGPSDGGSPAPRKH